MTNLLECRSAWVLAATAGGGLLVGTCVASGPAAAQTGEPDADAGREIYVENCQGCHGARGGGLVSFTGNGADFRRIVAGGGTNMPKFSGLLAPEEIDSVWGYLGELRR